MTTIKHIRQHFRQLVSPSLPQHWLDGWLLWLLDKPSSFLMTDTDHTLTDAQYQKLHEGIKKMQAGIPLAYLTGVQGFWHWDFSVNEHTLIPRADSEILVATTLAQIKAHFKTTHHATLLDLGTGTGCLGISLAKELPNWQITLSDKSPSALQVAKQNAQRLLASNVSCVVSDWYEHIDQRFDVIISNPPYIRADDPHLTKLHAEPMSALVATDNGLSDLDTIISHAKQHLLPFGLLVVEHGYDQKVAVQQKFAQSGFHHITTQQDFGGNDRITFGFNTNL